MIELALLAHLLADDSIESLVGDRIAVDANEQGAAKPRIVLKLRPGSQRHYHTLGASGLVEAAIEIVSYAATWESARAVYDAVRNAIDGFRGTWDTTEIDRCFLTTPFSATATPVHGDETGTPGVGCIADVFYFESVPTLGAPAYS